MTDRAPLPSSSPLPSPSLLEHRSSSRPLSEISDNSNSDHWRGMGKSLGNKSRPSSEVREGAVTPRRSSGVSGAGVQTIQVQTLSLNLNEYAKTAAKESSTPAPALGAVFGISGATVDPTSPTSPTAAGPPTSPVSKTDGRPTLPPRKLTGDKLKIKVTEADATDRAKPDNDGDEDEAEPNPLLKAKRASLRPSPLGASYAEALKPSTTASPASSTAESFETAPSTTDRSPSPSSMLRPQAKSKPSWLKRASGTHALRVSSRSPAHQDVTVSDATSAPSPPTLPPRRTKESSGPEGSSTTASRRTSYADVAAGSSQHRQSEDRPSVPAKTFPASGSAQPPPLPPREGIRSRIAAWSNVSQGSSGLSRSESTASLASTATGSGYGLRRMPHSASRVFGHAGDAVSKGWAGLRSKGVSGSISSMSSIAQGGRRSMDPSPSWASGLARRGSVNPLEAELPAGADGPVFEDGVIQRPAGTRSGRVFGRPLAQVGRAWGVVDAGNAKEGLSEYEQRRRACLPALVVRSVEYLEIWGPKEEGIFRISGRTSHLARLRREFDCGADLDLRPCHPADLDPHAVSGLFKSYLREMPTPVLTNELAPRFDQCVRKMQGRSEPGDTENEDLGSLLVKLPEAHWYLLADIVKLLDLIPKYIEVNRMTLNALMLSLGPSLNISGMVLDELLAGRDTLFKTPPPVDDTLIDFGEVNIDPPTLNISSANDSKTETTSNYSSLPSRSNTPLSSLSEENVPPTIKQKKRPPMLPKKPSIGRLFSVGSARSNSSRNTFHSPSEINLVSPISITPPPRVDVPITSSPLPTFDESPGDGMEQLASPTEARHTSPDIPRPSMSSGPSGSTCSSPVVDSAPVVPAPTITRSSSSSTPIADMFAGTSHQLGSLREARVRPVSVAGSITSMSTDSAAQSLRKRTAGPVFFSSSHVRNKSTSTIGSAKTSPVKSTIPTSLKRKEDGSVDEDKDGEDGNKAKRLSAGPNSFAQESVAEAVEIRE